MNISRLLPIIKEAASSHVTTCSSMQDWFAHHKAYTKDIGDSLARAMIGGAYFRQVSFAFASAYQSALENMFDLDQSVMGALCHNEKGVKKPREMQTRIYEARGELQLDAKKGFVSGGIDAQTLFVSAVDQRPSGDGKIVLLQLNNTNNALKLEALSPLPFVPELSHAKFLYEGLSIKQDCILEGDGYSDYIKPFRTEEDLHILAALCGQRIAIAFEFKQQPFVEQGIAIAIALLGLQTADRSAPSTHLALAGIKQQLHTLFEQHDQTLEAHLPEFARAWKRDKALLSLAETAQKIRSQTAWHFYTQD